MASQLNLETAHEAAPASLYSSSQRLRQLWGTLHDLDFCWASGRRCRRQIVRGCCCCCCCRRPSRTPSHACSPSARMHEGGAAISGGRCIAGARRCHRPLRNSHSAAAQLKMRAPTSDACIRAGALMIWWAFSTAASTPRANQPVAGAITVGVHEPHAYQATTNMLSINNNLNYRCAPT